MEGVRRVGGGRDWLLAVFPSSFRIRTGAHGVSQSVTSRAVVQAATASTIGPYPSRECHTRVDSNLASKYYVLISLLY